MHNVLKYDSCTAQYLVLQKRIFMFLILHKLFAKITVAMEFAKKVEKFVKPNYKKKTTLEAKHYSFPKVHSNWILSHYA